MGELPLRPKREHCRFAEVGCVTYRPTFQFFPQDRSHCCETTVLACHRHFIASREIAEENLDDGFFDHR